MAYNIVIVVMLIGFFGVLIGPEKGRWPEVFAVMLLSSVIISPIMLGMSLT